MTTLEKYVEARRSGLYTKPQEFKTINASTMPEFIEKPLKPLPHQSNKTLIIIVTALVVMLLTSAAWHYWPTKVSTTTPKAKPTVNKPLKKVNKDLKQVNKPSTQSDVILNKETSILDKEIGKIAWLQFICNQSRKLGLACYEVYYNNENKLVYK